MQNLPANVLSYLSKHLIKNYGIEWQANKEINNVIVIPAIAEYDNIKVLLKSLSENDPLFFLSSLILFVIKLTKLLYPVYIIIPQTVKTCKNYKIFTIIKLSRILFEGKFKTKSKKTH